MAVLCDRAVETVVVTGCVLVCYRDGHKVFRPYVAAHDPREYAADGVERASAEFAQRLARPKA